jgi:hypothetical protein
MKKVKIAIPESLYLEFIDLAKEMDRDPDDLIRAALTAYQLQRRPRPPAHSILDIKPRSLGKVLKPWKSRAEMLEDFFDRGD